MAVINNNKKEQGYPLTTSYGASGNLTSRGYPSSTDGYSGGSTGTNLKDRGYADSTSGVGGAGYTGSKLGGSGSSGNVRSIGSGGSSSRSRSSGRSSGGGSSASAAVTANPNNMANAYRALIDAYQRNNYDDYLAQMRQAAQNAYDNGMSALNNAYNSQINSLNDNLNSTKNQLLDSYNRSKQNITDDAAQSLREAYINRMKSERNLAQQMSAMGLNGGATETTLAGMLNNYGNARNNINTTTNRNLSSLEGNYNDNLAQAMQAYNSAVANASAQKAQQAIALENALANNQISAMSDYQSLMQSNNQAYLDLLKSAIANGVDFTYDPTSAINGVNALDYQQAAVPTNDYNYAAYQALMNAQQTPGTNTAAVSVNNPATQNNYLAQILAQLGR